MTNFLLILVTCLTVFTISLGQSVLAQGVEPYPHAITDRLIHQETPMALPAVGVLFHDPDFGAAMVRVTDQNTNFKTPKRLRED